MEMKIHRLVAYVVCANQARHRAFNLNVRGLSASHPGIASRGAMFWRERWVPASPNDNSPGTPKVSHGESWAGDRS